MASNEKARSRRAEQGFTLLEMMVVVAIIGILSAIGIPSVTKAVHQARMNATTADIRAAGHAWLIESARKGRDNGDPGFGDALGPCPRLLTIAEIRMEISSTARTVDHFGNPLEYRVDQYPNPSMLMIRSPNVDREFQTDYTFGTTFSIDDHVQDIVWFETGFAQRPES